MNQADELYKELQQANDEAQKETQEQKNTLEIKQEPDANKEEIKTEIKKDTQKEPEAKGQESDIWNVLSKEVGVEFKSKDDIRKLLNDNQELQLKIKDFDEVSKKLSEREKLIETLKEYTDPLKHFASPEEYKKQKLLAGSEKASRKFLSQILDGEGLSDFDFLKLNEQFENPDVKGDTVSKALMKRYGIDPETPQEEWDDVAKYNMNKDAKEKRDKINRALNEIKLPESVDVEKEKSEKEAKQTEFKQRLEKEWGDFSKTVELKEIQIPIEKDGNEVEYFNFPTDEEFRKKLPSMIHNAGVNGGYELNKESYEDLKDMITQRYIYYNLPKIAKALVESKKAEWEIESDKKRHNPGEPNRQEAPSKEVVDDPQESLLAEKAKLWGIK